MLHIHFFCEDLIIFINFLGDSGYALQNFLLTPVAQPQTPAQHLYNEAQIRTRNSVERLFGVWKRRFPILAYGCRLKLSTVLSVIPACAVLHNIAIEMNEGMPPIEENIAQLDYLIEAGNIPNVVDEPMGRLNPNFVRNEVVNYFANLR